MARRAATVALISLVTTELGQSLVDSHAPLVLLTSAGSFAAFAAMIATPGISQLLGCTPIGPIGWGIGVGSAAAAVAAVAAAPRLLPARWYEAGPSAALTAPTGDAAVTELGQTAGMSQPASDGDHDGANDSQELVASSAS